MTEPIKPITPCRNCKGIKYWLRDTQYICATCHPPVDNDKVEILEVK